MIEEAKQLYAAAQQPQKQNMPQPENTLDPEMVLTDPAKWQRDFIQQVNAAQQTQLASVAGPVVQGLKESARWMSESDKANKTAYGKWGNEIDKLVEDAIRVGATPNKALYDQAAKMVKANHLEELVAEQMERRAAANPHTNTANSAPTVITGNTKDDDSLWEKVEQHPHGKALVAAVGRSGVERTAREQGWNLKSYLESIVGSKVRHDPMNPGRWSNAELTR